MTLATINPAPTRVGHVCSALRARIESRALVKGARLPSVRRLSEELEVSKSTVVEAYDRLAAEGLVEARRGSGFFVAAPPQPFVLASAPRLDPAVDLVAIVRAAMEERPEELQPASGWLPEDWLPSEGVDRAIRLVLRGSSKNKLRYDSPFGYEPLRRLIAARLGERGLPVDPARIVLADSTTQAIDLALRFHVRAGDRVVVDDPCYFNLAQLIGAHRAELTAVPYTREGPDLAALERIFAERRPRVYVALSGPHNPTGTTLSAATAHRVLTLAEKYDVVVVEDDIYGDFESSQSPRLAAFDGFSRVIYVGGFTKTVSAALRVSYLVGRPEWMEAIVDLKLATTLGSSAFAAAAVHAYLAEGGYRRHLESLRVRLASASTHALQRLRALGLRPWVEPRAGVFVWAELPDGLDAAEVARLGHEERVVFAPGRMFSASPQWRGYMRFNLAVSADRRVFETLERAMNAARRKS
jgi:DNA-binding transcriptional MocR family regulator